MVSTEIRFAPPNHATLITEYSNNHWLECRALFVFRPTGCHACSGAMADVWTVCRRLAVVSARLHAAFFECCTCFRGGQKFDQRLGRLCFLSTDDQAAGEYSRLLHVRRQRTDVINTRKIPNLADLLEADLDFAVGNHCPHNPAARRLLKIVLDLVGHAQLLKQAHHVDAAWACRITDRFGCQHGFLYRLAGADVWPGCTLRDATPTPGFRYTDTAPGHALPNFYLRVD